jgi:3-oxoacyl-[acyl-carrier protein] reductase
MDLGLGDRVAVVVGSSRGIGRAIAIRLAREGARLVICARGSDALERTANEIRSMTSAEVLAVQADVTRSEDITALIALTLDRHKAIDILVANGGGPPYATFQDVTPDAWDASYQMILRSLVLLCRETVPHMQGRRWGRIIAIASVTAKQQIPGLMVSGVMRAGVVGFTKNLSQELAPFQITVNAVCPGYIGTEKFIEGAGARAANQGAPVQKVVKKIIDSIPVGRLGTPEEVAAVVAFLASDHASYVTGTMIPVDGGVIQAVM